MAGRADPPEGTPEGLPGGGEDEYRSVVFDESFVKAARLQEFSAQERMAERTRAVRSLPSPASRSGSTVALLLVLLIAALLGTAVYLGVRDPSRSASAKRAEPLRITLIPLAPRGPVPGGDPADLYAHSPAARFRVGASGITLPGAQRTENFSESQVMTALTTAKDYLVESSLDPEVLTGGAVRPVRILLDPDQLEQFDRSMNAPAADGYHVATGWLVRYPAAVVLADPEVRVRGTMSVVEAGPDALEVTSDHTFAYALRRATPARSGTPDATGAASGAWQASLFTVRRELTFRFDRDDLHQHRAELLASYVQAGPQRCADDASRTLRPLLAGERTTGRAPADTDPYSLGEATAALCGSLASDAQPTPPR
ncbi:SCO2583 family membrane protein [Streptomyces jumonjinensis]|uniref:SCO2583 family membrane protein n=1 Tax=Streptomyces jumonjinensis TaxID=1945 RepID=UPI0037AB0B60